MGTFATGDKFTSFLVNVGYISPKPYYAVNPGLIFDSAAHRIPRLERTLPRSTVACIPPVSVPCTTLQATCYVPAAYCLYFCAAVTNNDALKILPNIRSSERKINNKIYVKNFPSQYSTACVTADSLRQGGVGRAPLSLPVLTHGT